jgi:hypothetical protein
VQRNADCHRYRKHCAQNLERYGAL